ncbi:hypothetical protein A2533_04740 [Candidatus Falkowbacteria bacterium RIFOXYD2_FULL_35_9]|nr:MAG: hypothetical protein A2533_04740 [Candidatus Falkowbacteria bacterium RIFOXYD2_FULL_35_9]
MCHEFQEAVTDVLALKTLNAAEKLKVKSILIGGGVSANKALRTKIQNLSQHQLPNVEIKIPEIQFTGDNAVMITLPAYFHFKNNDFIDPTKFRPDPNWELV